MSDLETLKELFDRVGIVYEHQQVGSGVSGGHELHLVEGMGPHNIGYPGFMTFLYFDANGTLIAVGAWE